MNEMNKTNTDTINTDPNQPHSGKDSSGQDDDQKTADSGKFLIPAQSMLRMTDRLIELETFVARRFDELSMEINATAQQMDYTEDGLNKQFNEVLEIMKGVSFSGDGSTPANTGVELSAVLEVTEASANKIIDATERINTTLENHKDSIAPEIISAIEADLQEILMSCEFQDITGQRIRKAVDNLTTIESKLSSTLDKMGVDVTATANSESEISKDLHSQTSSQDDIDALFD